jgi:pimeloyl-ACP methyl ester carboxylesterase
MSSYVNRERPVFTLTSPHYCNPWVWREFLVPELAAQGYDSVAPDLPIEDPAMTRDNHASIIREVEERKGAENYVEVGASWGGDLIYRQLGGVPVSKLVFIGAPLRPILRKTGLMEIDPLLENNPNISYLALVRAEEGGVSFDRQSVGDVFFRDLGNEGLKAWATSQLSEHPHNTGDHSRSDDNAVLPRTMDMHYVGLMDDKILSFTNQKHTADVLGLDFVPFPSGHFPMLQKPKQLAELLIQIAEGRLDRQHWAEIYRQERLRKLKEAISYS